MKIYIVFIILTLIYSINILSNAVYKTSPFSNQEYNKFIKNINKIVKNEKLVQINNKIIYIKNPYVKTTLFIIHSHHKKIYDLLKYVELFYNFSSIVIFDYDTKNNNLDNYKKRCLSVWNYLNELKIDNSNVIILGNSFGSYYATYLVYYLSVNFLPKPKSLILEEPINNIESVIYKLFENFHPELFSIVLSKIIINDFNIYEYIKYINFKINTLIIYNNECSLKLYNVFENENKKVEYIKLNKNNDNYIYSISNLLQ